MGWKELKHLYAQNILLNGLQLSIHHGLRLAVCSLTKIGNLANLNPCIHSSHFHCSLNLDLTVRKNIEKTSCYSLECSTNCKISHENNCVKSTKRFQQGNRVKLADYNIRMQASI